MIIAAGPIMNYVLALFLYVSIIVIGGELVIVDDGLRVGELTKEWPAETAGLQQDDLLVAIDGIPLEEFLSMPVEQWVER